MTFTFSGAERALRCVGSTVLPPANTASVWADTGNDGHDELEGFIAAVQGGMSVDQALESVDLDWFELCAALGDLAPALRTEIAFAVNVETGAARILGERLKRRYVLKEHEIAGTLDLAGVTETHAIVLDLKTGWGDVTPARYNRQLRVGALAVCRALGRAAAKVAILRCHEGGVPSWDWAELDVFDLDEIGDEVRRTYRASRMARAELETVGRVPAVSEGSWCKYCPAMPACPAKQRIALTIAEGRLLDGIDACQPMDAVQAGRVHEAVKAAEMVIAAAKKGVTAALERHGALPLSGGRELRNVMVEGNEKLDGEVVFQVVEEMYGAKVANDALELKATKKRLKEALSQVVAKGVNAAQEAVLDRVRKLGGATTSMYSKPVEKMAELRDATPAAAVGDDATGANALPAESTESTGANAEVLKDAIAETFNVEIPAGPGEPRAEVAKRIKKRNGQGGQKKRRAGDEPAVVSAPPRDEALERKVDEIESALGRVFADPDALETANGLIESLPQGRERDRFDGLLVAAKRTVEAAREIEA